MDFAHLFTAESSTYKTKAIIEYLLNVTDPFLFEIL